MSEAETAMRASGLPVSATSKQAFLLATQLNLSIATYNSGVRTNRLNGWRVFQGLGTRDYFQGDEMAHVANPRELMVFLKGYQEGWFAALRRTGQKDKT
jgi:hypothetical protein